MTIKIGTKIPTSTGGVITYTRTGLIHAAGKSYSGRSVEVTEGKKKA